MSFVEFWCRSRSYIWHLPRSFHRNLCCSAHLDSVEGTVGTDIISIHHAFNSDKYDFTLSHSLRMEIFRHSRIRDDKQELLSYSLLNLDLFCWCRLVSPWGKRHGEATYWENNIFLFTSSQYTAAITRPPALEKCCPPIPQSRIVVDGTFLIGIHTMLLFNEEHQSAYRGILRSGSGII